MSTTCEYSAEVVDCNGAPALAVNGKPVFLSAPYLAKARYRDFEASAPEVYLLHDHAFVVPQNGEPEVRTVVEQIDALLGQDPDAVVIIRSFPPAPTWWLDQHPDEEMRFDVDVREYPGYEDCRDASWASEEWLDAVEGWYHAWCGELHRRYGGRIVGHQFGMGSCGENNPIGACASDGRWFCSDFSPAMHTYFQGWLKARYGTDAALREAWGEHGGTLATASVPTRLERLRTDWFTFRDPRKAKVADYYRAFAERIEQIVIRICEAIKRATDGHCVAGSHLGGILDNGFHGYLYHQACINSVRNALRHPAVDLFTSPASYENRVPGGDATSMMPVGSYVLHGKLVFQDQDTRTSVLPPGYREGFTLGRIAADIRESVEVLKRDVAHAVIHGYGLFWHAMVPGMYDHPQIGTCIARLSEIGRRSLRVPRGIAEGVAIIVDEESAFHQQCANRILYPMLYYQRQHCWNRSGVAWNLFLHNDLEHPRMPDHKVYYFLNTFYLTDEEVVAIEKKVKRSNAIVIWTYAPGIQSPAGLCLERAERLTGFRLKAVDVEALPRITLTDFHHPYVRYQPPGRGDRYLYGAVQPMSFGTGPMGNDERERILGPLIYVDDSDATVLGELDALQVPGFCVKKMDGWTSVFCSAPMLNAYLLRNIARTAGVHVYSESNDVVLPGKSFVMLHAQAGGEKALRLPAPADVLECYDDHVVGRGITEIRETLPEYGTRIYFCGALDAYQRST